MVSPCWQYVRLLHAYTLEVATQRTFFLGKSENKKAVMQINIYQIQGGFINENKV